MTAREVNNWSWAGQKPSFSGNQQSMPLMLPQALRAMDQGNTLIFTHVAKGPVQAYLEFPPELSASGHGKAQPTTAPPAPGSTQAAVVAA